MNTSATTMPECVNISYQFDINEIILDLRSWVKILKDVLAPF